MMTYYLIIVICLGGSQCAWNGSVSVATITFNSLESCQEAGLSIIKNSPNNTNLSATCVGDIKEAV